jgi:hypothetical protein
MALSTSEDMSGSRIRTTSVHVRTIIEKSSAIRAKQVGPADRITTFVSDAPARRRVVVSALPTIVADQDWFRFDR